MTVPWGVGHGHEVRARGAHELLRQGIHGRVVLGGHGGGKIRIARNKVAAVQEAPRRSGDGGVHHLLAAGHAVHQFGVKRFFHMINGNDQHYGAADDQGNKQ